MKKVLGIIILSLFNYNFSFADVVPGSEWKEVYKSGDIKWLVDFKSIVMAGDLNNKDNFYFLWLQTSDKPLREGSKVKTRLAREQINCNKSIIKADLAQIYDVAMENGLTNKGKTLGTKKYDNDSAKWRNVNDDSAITRIKIAICGRYKTNKMIYKMQNDPEEQKKFKEFLKKQGIKTN